MRKETLLLAIVCLFLNGCATYCLWAEGDMGYPPCSANPPAFKRDNYKPVEEKLNNIFVKHSNVFSGYCIKTDYFGEDKCLQIDNVSTSDYELLDALVNGKVNDDIKGISFNLHTQSGEREVYISFYLSRKGPEVDSPEDSDVQISYEKEGELVSQRRDILGMDENRIRVSAGLFPSSLVDYSDNEYYPLSDLDCPVEVTIWIEDPVQEPETGPNILVKILMTPVAIVSDVLLTVVYSLAALRP